jgi:hypothetical protein
MKYRLSHFILTGWWPLVNFLRFSRSNGLLTSFPEIAQVARHYSEVNFSSMSGKNTTKKNVRKVSNKVYMTPLREVSHI